MVKSHLCCVNKIHLHIKTLIMKSIFNLLIFLIFSVIIPFTGFAQLTLDTSKNLPTAEQYKKIKKYEATVNLHNKKNVKGLLYKVNEEIVTLIPMDEYANRYSHFVKLVKEEQIPINLTNIHHIRARRAGKKGTGLLIGVLIGGGLGALTTKSEVVSPGPVIGLGALVGGILGGLLGGASAKTYTSKNKAKLEELKKRGIMFGYD